MSLHSQILDDTLLVDPVRATLNQWVFEIRYAPEARVLDNIGSLTSGISSSMKLTEWQAGINRVDVYDTDRTMRCFVSFQNAGMVMRNVPDAQTFTARVSRFLSSLMQLRPFSFSSRLILTRVGVRMRAAQSVNGGFDENLRRYLEKVVQPNPAIIEAFGGKLTDIAMPMYIDAPFGSIHTTSGIMDTSQLKGFFDDEAEENLPDHALFFEVDYFQKDLDPLLREGVTTLARQLIQGNSDIWDRFRAIVLDS